MTSQCLYLHSLVWLRVTEYIYDLSISIGHYAPDIIYRKLVYSVVYSTKYCRICTLRQ